MSAIKVGGLVMVVKGPFSGAPGVVAAGLARREWRNCYTSEIQESDGYIVDLDRPQFGGTRWCLQPHQIIKIDPPAEMKDTETEKELTV